MDRRNTLSLFSIAALGLALLASDAVGQQKSLKDQFVGTWTFVSVVETRADGSRIDRLGSNPKGLFMFDASGHYAQFITRSDIPKFAAATVDQGTAEENKAVLAGFIAGFGTYTVNEADKMLITRVEGNVFPNLVGTDQKRIIVSLTADELKYTNPATSLGAKAEVTWKRVK
jgi:hypothetical protein